MSTINITDINKGILPDVAIRLQNKVGSVRIIDKRIIIFDKNNNKIYTYAAENGEGVEINI